MILVPDPRTLPGDPASFAFGLQMLVGPADRSGEESFGLTVCSPERLAARCASGEPVNGLHHVIVDSAGYDERTLRSWLQARIAAVEAASWEGVAAQLRFLGEWEFEGYRPRTPSRPSDSGCCASYRQ